MRLATSSTTFALSLALTTLALLLSSCTRDAGDGGAEMEHTGAVVLRAWAHAGQESEREVIRAQVARFNASRDSIQVELTLLPEGSYNAQVQAAALAGDLPDLLEFDGPFVYNYVWQGHLVPIDGFLAPGTRAALLPSIIAQGTYRGHLYSLGQFDSGLGLYGRRGQLKAIGARIPTSPAEAWTVDEFEEVLEGLSRLDQDRAVLDLKLNYQGEWFTYAFSPIVQSAGGDLIDRNDYQSAAGTLDDEAVVAAMKKVQRWIRRRGYVDPNLDDDAFVSGRVALSWVGHWEYPRYAEARGDDLVVLPLPDFGAGSRTGQGSWNWGVTAHCRHPHAAVAFIEFLLEDEQVLEMTGANGAVPATWSAIEKSPLYGAMGPLRLFVTQLADGFAVPRPQTPAYPVITSVFQQAFDGIRNGGNVADALGEAAAEIDRDLHDNRGYPFLGEAR
jgi:multiple sugar transport system substrate-binding protein